MQRRRNPKVAMKPGHRTDVRTLTSQGMDHVGAGVLPENHRRDEIRALAGIAGAVTCGAERGKGMTGCPKPA